MTAWTPAELKKLTALTTENLSAAEIAQRLNTEFGNGRSRCAVIGKVERGNGRLGKLTSRRTYLAGTKAKTGRPVLAASRSRSAALSLGCAGKTGAVSSPAALVTFLPLPSKLPPVEVLTVSPPCAGYSVPAVPPMAFLDALFDERCLHFVGDRYGPSGPDMPVCGAKRAEGVHGTRYCRRHLLGQYQARAVA